MSFKIDRSRPGLVVAVWKDKLDHVQSHDFATGLSARLEGERFPFEVALAPGMIALREVEAICHPAGVKICGQNVLWQAESGSFIGETPAATLAKAGADYVIVGHSERRIVFGETGEMVRNKAAAALAADITPVVCVGDTAEEHSSGGTAAAIRRQVEDLFLGLPPDLPPSSLILAYEPVWAISTWRTSSPLPTGPEVESLHLLVRGEIEKLKGADFASQLGLLYGGSVAPDNIFEYFRQSEVDGALVGGASKTLDSFWQLLTEARRAAAD